MYCFYFKGPCWWATLSKDLYYRTCVRICLKNRAQVTVKSMTIFVQFVPANLKQFVIFFSLVE